MSEKLFYKPLGSVFVSSVLASSASPSLLLSSSALSLFVGVVGVRAGAYRRFGLPRAIFLSFITFGVASDLFAKGGRVYTLQVISFSMVYMMLSRPQAVRILGQLQKANYIIKTKEGRCQYYEFTPRAKEKYQALKAHCQDVESRRAAYIREALEILDKKKER